MGMGQDHLDDMLVLEGQMEAQAEWMLENKTWTTEDGRTLNIKDMSYLHLVNTVKWLDHSMNPYSVDFQLMMEKELRTRRAPRPVCISSRRK